MWSLKAAAGIKVEGSQSATDYIGGALPAEGPPKGMAYIVPSESESGSE